MATIVDLIDVCPLNHIPKPKHPPCTTCISSHIIFINRPNVLVSLYQDQKNRGTLQLHTNLLSSVDPIANTTLLHVDSIVPKPDRELDDSSEDQ